MELTEKRSIESRAAGMINNILINDLYNEKDGFDYEWFTREINDKTDLTPGEKWELLILTRLTIARIESIYFRFVENKISIDFMEYQIGKGNRLVIYFMDDLDAKTIKVLSELKYTKRIDIENNRLIVELK